MRDLQIILNWPFNFLIIFWNLFGAYLQKLIFIQNKTVKKKSNGVFVKQPLKPKLPQQKKVTNQAKP